MIPAEPNLAVLISGGGRTLLNLHERIVDGSLRAKIGIVICSRGDVAGVERARNAGLKTVVVERRKIGEDAFQVQVTEHVREADLVCMAGFLSLWRIPEAFTGRVINIHPALLPDFGGKGMYGKRVHEAVLNAGGVLSGCTVHFCDNEYDHGPIVLQRQTPVKPGDTPSTLADRVFEEECLAYPEAIRMLAAGEVRLENGEAVFADRNR